jgi:hypothetical protein
MDIREPRRAKVALQEAGRKYQKARGKSRLQISKDSRKSGIMARSHLTIVRSEKGVE